MFFEEGREREREDVVVVGERISKTSSTATHGRECGSRNVSFIEGCRGGPCSCSIQMDREKERIYHRKGHLWSSLLAHLNQMICFLHAFT